MCLITVLAAAAAAILNTTLSLSTCTCLYLRVLTQHDMAIAAQDQSDLTGFGDVGSPEVNVDVDPTTGKPKITGPLVNESFGDTFEELQTTQPTQADGATPDDSGATSAPTAAPGEY
jgi:hypothetical protein